MGVSNEKMCKKVEQNNADIHYVLNPNYFYLLNNQ